MAKRKYSFVINVTISMNTDVEASSLAEAIEEAQTRPFMSLCHQCASGDSETEWVTSGELDAGDPSASKLVYAMVDDETVDDAKLARIQKKWKS